jgi:hypothetical protein
MKKALPGDRVSQEGILMLVDEEETIPGKGERNR